MVKKVQLLVLKNQHNHTLRVFKWESEIAFVIYRKEIRRLDLSSDSEKSLLKNNKIKIIKKIHHAEFQSPLQISDNHYLTVATDKEDLEFVKEPYVSQSTDFSVTSSLTLSSLVFLTFLGLYLARPDMNLQIQPKAKIVSIPVDVNSRNTLKNSHQFFIEKPKSIKKAVKKPLRKSLKKMGALQALGQLSKMKKQIGGLNLNKLESRVSKGAGIRNLAKKSQGGLQKHLYSKGLITASLGSSGQIRGGGEYETKDTSEGGGRKGYGKLSLVGLEGKVDVSSSQFALSSGFFDPSSIDTEIAKNSGRIHECYDKALEKEPNLKGIFSVFITISNKGAVLNSQTHPQSEVKSQNLSACVLKLLNNLTFDMTLNTESIRVLYRFNLTALGERGE